MRLTSTPEEEDDDFFPFFHFDFKKVTIRYIYISPCYYSFCVQFLKMSISCIYLNIFSTLYNSHGILYGHALNILFYKSKYMFMIVF